MSRITKLFTVSALALAATAGVSLAGPPGIRPVPTWSGYGNPGYGNPGYGNPGYGNPAFGNPGYGVPGRPVGFPGQPGFPGRPSFSPGFPARPIAAPVHHEYEVRYRTCHHEPWRCAGHFDCRRDADCVAHRLQHRGFEAVVVCSH